MPWGYEQNNLAYNEGMLKQIGASVPTNMSELIEVAAKATKEIDGVYGIGVRGSRSWATIHPGFLSAYANFNEKDLNVAADGKLSAAMNTAGSKAFHADWVRMIQESGAADWSSHTWYQVGTDLGAGKSAMISALYVSPIPWKKDTACSRSHTWRSITSSRSTISRIRASMVSRSSGVKGVGRAKS